jgi:hypothetical protein
MKRLVVVTGLALALAYAVASVAAPHDEDNAGPGHAVYKVDKNGQVKIGDKLMVGATVVPKGRYVLEHRVEGSQHVIVLTAIATKGASDAWTREFQMQLIPEKKVAKGSALFADDVPDGSVRFSALQIAGEAGDHILYTGAN